MRCHRAEDVMLWAPASFRYRRREVHARRGSPSHTMHTEKQACPLHQDTNINPAQDDLPTHPSTYLISPTSLAKPHATDHLTADFCSYNPNPNVASWLKAGLRNITQMRGCTSPTTSYFIAIGLSAGWCMAWPPSVDVASTQLSSNHKQFTLRKRNYCGFQLP